MASAAVSMPSFTTLRELLFILRLVVAAPSISSSTMLPLGIAVVTLFRKSLTSPTDVILDMVLVHAAPGRRQLLVDELRRARAATGGWIDTDFYKGFMQVFFGIRLYDTSPRKAAVGRTFPACFKLFDPRLSLFLLFFP